MFNSQLKAIIISESEPPFLSLLKSYFPDIETFNIHDGHAHLLSKSPTLIFINAIPANEILLFRKENYHSRFILFAPHHEHDFHLLAQCQITKMLTDATPHAFYQAIREAEEELELLQKNFLVQFENNYSWHLHRRILYDNSCNQVALTKNETILMELFIRHANRVLSVDTILLDFEERGERINIRTLRNLITFLRKKVSKGVLQNVYGEGYRFILQPSKQHLSLESFHTFSTRMQRAKSDEELHQLFCDTLLALYDCDRAFTMYIDKPRNRIKVPFEASVGKYPGARAIGVEIPLTQTQMSALEKITGMDEPVILNETLLKQAEADHPDVWKKMAIPRSALVSYFLIDGTVWVAGLHQCSFERRWSHEEVVFLKYAIQNLQDKMLQLSA